MIESVQRRFTKRVHGLAHRSYLDRLSALNADTLEYRRLIADLQNFEPPSGHLRVFAFSVIVQH